MKIEPVFLRYIFIEQGLVGLYYLPVVLLIANFF